MSVCRMGWPYSKTLRYLDKGSRKAIEKTGQTFVQKVFESWEGPVLVQWSSAEGFIRTAAGGRIIIEVPATKFVAPLRAGTFPTEIRRVDDGSNRVVLRGLITVGKAVQA